MKSVLKRMALPVAAVMALLSVSGTAAAGAAPGTVHLNGVRTSLTTDRGTTAALVSHGILPLPVGPATVTPVARGGLALRYGFAITGGRVDAETLAGRIRHSGGIRFLNVANGRTLTLTNFTIVISAHPGLTAVVNGDPRARVRILNLDLSNAGVAKHVPWVRVSGVDATLTTTAATALNGALGVSLFHRGIPLGTAVVRAHIG